MNDLWLAVGLVWIDCEQFGQKEIKAIPDVKEAFEEALREKGDGILFCVGSLYLVGSIKKILRDKEDGK